MNYKEIEAIYVDVKGGCIKFENFVVIRKSNNYFSVLDEFGYEITSGKSFGNAAKKAKLLQIGYNSARDRYESWRYYK